MATSILYEPTLRNAKPHVVPAISGLLTVIAADADVYSFQNAASNKAFIVSQITMSFHTTTNFGTAQTLAFGLFKVAGFTVSHSAGTGIKTIAAHRKRIAGARALASVNVKMAAAVAITGATYTAPDADEPDMILVTSGAVATSGEAIWTPGDRLPFVLDQNEGFVVRPLVTMGATGVGQLYVRVEGFTQNEEANA